MLTNTQLVILALAVGIILAVVYRACIDGKKQGSAYDPPKNPGDALSGFDRMHPSKPGKTYRLAQGVHQKATLAPSPATGVTGIQWHQSWRFPRNDDGAFIFTTRFDRGLIIGLSPEMSDTAGGYVIHLRSPDHDRQGVVIYGISDMQQFRYIHEMQSEPEKSTKLCPSQPVQTEPETFWVRYMPGGRMSLGRGDDIGKNVIFSADYPFRTKLHNQPMEGIRFFGFGTSCDSLAGYREIDGVGVVTSQLPS